jgi:polyribonucleotide nucleotidyltransferase
MDFKLCGTTEGVTGFQLDLKLPGIPLDLFCEGVDKATKGRFTVLDIMNQVISEPKALSDYAPRIESLKIDPKKIGELIGPGGKNIKGIQAETGADINIDDSGTVSIYAANPEALARAIELVERVSAEIEVGKTYEGKVVSTTNFGAFVEVLPGKDGMIHISELADFRVDKVEDVVKVGDIVAAKCIGIDERGRVKLSRKVAMAERGEAASAELSEG